MKTKPIINHSLPFFVLLAILLLFAHISHAQTFRTEMKMKEKRAVAQELGDTFIAEGTPAVYSRIPQMELTTYIDQLIEETGSATPEVRVEANQQIQRLWRLCVPRLIENLGNENATINEAVMKNLILMRDADVVERLIDKIDGSSDPMIQQSGIFALGMMKEERKTLIPNRKTLDTGKFSEIATTRIEPYIEQLKSSIKNKETAALIEQSRQMLRKE